MNYLVVMPKNLAVGASTNSVLFPLGLAYVSASLKAAGKKVTTANLAHMEGDTEALLRSLILDNDIDVLCTGGLSLDFHKIKEVIDLGKQIKPNLTTVVGGGIVSSDPDVAFPALGADFGVLGEGEVSIVELADALENGLDLSTVSGLIYSLDDGTVHRTPPRQEIANIDTIPFPDFDGFNYAEFVRNTSSGMIITDRSCPLRCTFCFHPTGQRYRQRTLDNIFAEIDLQVSQYDIRHLGLTSELFAISKDRILGFANRIKPYGLSWSCSLRVRDVDSDLLATMKDSGCGSICFGLESADDTILKSMRKGITVKQIARALNLAYEAGIEAPDSNFIFGDRNETTTTVKTTLDFWNRYRNRMHINLSMIQTYPGTQLYDYACQTGVIRDKVKFLKDGCPVVNVSKLDDLEFRWLRSLIAELRLEPHVPAASLRLVDLDDNAECTTEFVCRKCGGTVTSTGVYFWHRRVVPCGCCGLGNEIEPFRCADIQEGEFFAALPMEETIAIWCSTANGAARGVFYKLAKVFPRLTSNRFALIDTDPELHGLRLLGMEVHDPEIFRKLQIRCAVITDMTDTAAAHETLLTACPSVTNVLVPSFRVQGDDVIPLLAHYPS